MPTHDLILKKKPSAVLVLLKDGSQTWYPSRLASYSGASYVYVTSLLTRFQQAGLVRFERTGRKKIARLTDQGAAIASLLDDIIKKTAEHKERQEQKRAPETR